MEDEINQAELDLFRMPVQEKMVRTLICGLAGFVVSHLVGQVFDKQYLRRLNKVEDIEETEE